MNLVRATNLPKKVQYFSLLLILVMVVSTSLVGNAAKLNPNAITAGTVVLPDSAQQVTLSLESTAKDTKQDSLDSALVELANAAKTSLTGAMTLADEKMIRRSGTRIQIQAVTTPERLSNVAEVIEKAGGEVTGSGFNNTLLQGWLPIAALETVAAHPSIDYLRVPEQVTLLDTNVGVYTTEGLAVMNGSAWHSAGFYGSGVKVAIIDAGFQGYPSLMGSDLPASVTVKNFVDGENDSQVNGLTVHGAACAETIYDIAPQATMFLAKISTDIDLQEAVNWAKSNNVDVISTSLGWYNTSPGDGTGYLASIVQDARSNGIIWVTGAGNNRESHWGGAYNDSNGDGYHEFNTNQNIDFYGPGDGSAYGINPGYRFCVFLRWDDWSAVNQDYDLYLLRYDGSSWSTVASSQNYQDGGGGQTPTEGACYTTTGSAMPYGFAIKRYSSNRNVNVEVFATDFVRLDELVYARSLLNLADAPDAMTVSALDVVSPHTQEYYSAEGPTNGPGGTAGGGFIKPDISGYANVSTVSYDLTGFAGTSAATPHVAGAAVLVQNAYPSYTPAQLESFLTGRAIDMGIAGLDNVYGYGRLYLGAPPSTNTAPVISGLPDQSLPTNSSKDNAFDLWTYASDNESPDSSLTFTINNTPNASAGVSIDSNRYIDINPAAGWNGQTDVEIKVTDPGALFSSDTFRVTVSNLKTWTGSVNSDWHTAGNWNPSGVPTTADTVSIPNVTNDPVISTADAAVKDLTIDVGAILDLTTRTLNVEGTLTNNGTLKQTKTITPGVTSQFIRITNQAVTQTKYYGLDFTQPVIGNLEAVSDITIGVSILGNQFCSGRSTGVKRCFDITPLSSVTATVRFYFTEAERNSQVLGDLRVFHYGTSWTQEPGTHSSGGSGDSQYVQAQNINDFSLFALAKPVGSGIVHLPMLSQYIPPPPPVPSSGFWEGEAVDFTVTSDHNYVRNFKIYIYVDGCGYYEITHNVDEQISNLKFSFGDPNASGSYYASGTFTSNTAANGTAGLNKFNISGCGKVTGSFTWTATWKHSLQALLSAQEIYKLPESRLLPTIKFDRDLTPR
jgi:subtilisin family serine protease